MDNQASDTQGETLVSLKDLAQLGGFRRPRRRTVSLFFWEHIGLFDDGQLLIFRTTRPVQLGKCVETTERGKRETYTIEAIRVFGWVTYRYKKGRLFEVRRKTRAQAMNKYAGGKAAPNG
jgi:hypothetical protein